MNILHIDSSPEPTSSYSRVLSADIVSRLTSQHDGVTVAYRDLARDPPPHVDGALRNGWVTAPDQRSEREIEIVARCEGYIDEVKTSDVIVLGAPMHNLSIPSVLKAWIDHVVIANQTFRYTQTGPVGLISGKRAILALASGGIYSPPGASDRDFQQPYLRAIFAFIGFTAVEAIRVEGVSMGPESAASAVEKAKAAVANLLA